MEATADAPPVVEIEETEVPMSYMKERLAEVLIGQTVLYRGKNGQQQPMILFLVNLKSSLYPEAAKFNFIPTSNGIKITKLTN